jgi:hypothetical protein
MNETYLPPNPQEGGFCCSAGRLLAARSKSSSKGSALQSAWRSPSR